MCVCCCLAVNAAVSQKGEEKKNILFKKKFFIFVVASSIARIQQPIGSLPVENVGRTSKSEEAHQKKEKKGQTLIYLANYGDG